MSPLTVGVDVSATYVKQPTGVAAAISFSVQALTECPEVQVIAYSRLSRFRKRSLRPQWGCRHSWFLGPLMLKHGLQVFHGPDTRLPTRQVTPFVATVHDFSALQEQGFSKESFRQTRAQHYQDVVTRAQRFVVYTESIAKELQARYSVPRERIDVVPLAPALTLTDRPKDQVFSKTAPYVLLLGEISRRKNTAFAMETFLEAQARGLVPKDWRLKVAGRPGYGGESAQELMAKAPSGLEVLDYVPAADLPGLIQNAQFLYFPSLYEGFGLPVLEAMSLGTPVLCSDRGALKDVGAEAVCGINPEDPEAAWEALGQLSQDSEARRRLSQAGRERARDFSWTKTAQALIQCYRRAIKG